MNDLDSRVALLEAELSRMRASAAYWRRAVAVGAIAAASVAVLAACKEMGTDPLGAAPSPSPDTKKAPPTFREVRIASEDGMRELLLTPEGFTLRAAGKPRAELKAGATTALILGDGEGRARVSLLASNGPVGLSLLGPQGKDLAVFGASEEDGMARIELMGHGGAPRAALKVAPDGRGSMTIIGDPEERPTPLVPAASPAPATP